METSPKKRSYAGYVEGIAILALTLGAAIAIGAMLPVNFDPAAAANIKDSSGPAYTPEWQNPVAPPVARAVETNLVAKRLEPKATQKAPANPRSHLAKGFGKLRANKFVANTKGKHFAFHSPARRGTH